MALSIPFRFSTNVVINVLHHEMKGTEKFLSYGAKYIFPNEFMPKYYKIIFPKSIYNTNPFIQNLNFQDQVEYTKIIFYTTNIGTFITKKINPFNDIYLLTEYSRDYNFKIY